MGSAVPKDMTGREIKVGDRIVYPGRCSSNLWMNIARVYAIEEKESYSWGQNRRIPIVKVQTIKSSDGYTETGKKTFVQVLSRVLVLEGGTQ